MVGNREVANLGKLRGRLCHHSRVVILYRNSILCINTYDLISSSFFFRKTTYSAANSFVQNEPRKGPNCTSEGLEKPTISGLERNDKFCQFG